MLKAFEYRIYPTKEQEVLLAKHFGCVRFVYNHFLRVKIDHYASTKKNLSRFCLDKQIPLLKKSIAPWLQEVNAQSLCCSLAHLDSAYQRFFKLKKGFPKFKSKDDKQSFAIPQNLRTSFEKSIITLPKFKEGIQTLFHRKFQGTVKTCTIKKSKTYKYFVCILVENGLVLPTKPTPNINNAVGVDTGIKTFATLSSGEQIPNPRYLNKSLERLKKISRNFSRKRIPKKPPSKNSIKIKNKLTFLHEKIHNQRKDFLHKVSTRLVRENQTLCVETLSIKNMMRNHRVARGFQDVALGTFYRFLEYKTDWYGKNLLRIGRFEPSSKTCSVCGYVKQDLTLSDRVWTCPKCNTIHQRDPNASLNIKNMAFKELGLRNQAEVTPISYEDSQEPQSRKYSCEAVQSSLDSSESRREAHEFIRG